MLTPRKLFAPAVLTDVAAIYYTVPDTRKCIIKKLTFTNPDVAVHTVSVYLVPAPTTDEPSPVADDTNVLIKDKELAALETWECFPADNHVLNAGDTLQASADAAAVVVMMGSGLESVEAFR